ncbi:TonB-dependent receptor [Sphingobium nicotianae]|uniref:TonB-dependent receptor n=1 Tax=Sphingobium nicotianae TaxID=2782607 RepID=A0A9X1DDA9_9SPHN|nr:TonB-dependent receptor [Sphingobium nicotianae]MBT2187809.1 TonB-dependent receptor [Sphingobium nicotianae]
MAVSASRGFRVLMATSALVWTATPGFGQANTAPQAATPGTDDIIVTANRQGDTLLSKVPMSIVAKTQEALDQQGVKVAADLSRIVPALRIDDVTSGSSNISIRGVRSEVGSATTGVYIDDTPLQARTLGGSASGGGAFIPPIFDLQRVEVLKGPQGTLYGGSSQGGTVRFISVQPSLTTSSVSGRAEVNQVEKGEPGYEVGVAVGVPLIQEVMGLRIAAFERHTGGYINYIDRRNTANPVSKDDNWREQRLLRATLAIEPVTDLKINPSFVYAFDKKNAFDTLYRSIPAYTTPAYGTYLDAAPVGSPTAALGRGSPVGGRWTSGATGGLLPVGYVPPTTSGIVTDVPGSVGRRVWIHAAHTYPALNLGDYDSLETTNVADNYGGPVSRERNGRTNEMYMGNLALELDVGKLNIKSVSSYLKDTGKGTFTSSLISGVNATSTVGYAPSVNSPFIFDAAGPIVSLFDFNARREAKTQEVRLTYPQDESGISFVVGGYWNNATTVSTSINTNDRSAARLATFGIGQTFFPVHTAADIASLIQQEVVQNLEETSTAIFGEASYAFTDKLKLTLGARYSHEKIKYDQRTWGLLYNSAFGVGTLISGGSLEKPFTPKISLSYQATDDDLFYVTAAKGYRIGGVQGQASPTVCANDLAALGITNTPSTYGSDSVWNYEAGAKVRAFDRRLQLSGSVFYVKWSRPQTPYTLPTCAFQFTTNIGEAVSQGFDLQGTLRVANGFSIDFALGYTDAHFTQDVLTEPNAQGVRQLLVGKGMKLMEVPEWTGSLGARYEFAVNDGWKAYLFGSYQYTGSYKNTLGPGVLSYSPDSFTTPAIPNVLARVGMSNEHWDISLFADNLFGNKTLRQADLVGRTSCRDTNGCSTYGSYFPLVYGTALRPRTVGLTATIKY